MKSYKQGDNLDVQVDMVAFSAVLNRTIWNQIMASSLLLVWSEETFS